MRVPLEVVIEVDRDDVADGVFEGVALVLAEAETDGDGDLETVLLGEKLHERDSE